MNIITALKKTTIINLFSCCVRVCVCVLIALPFYELHRLCEANDDNGDGDNGDSIMSGLFRLCSAGDDCDSRTNTRVYNATPPPRLRCSLMSIVAPPSSPSSSLHFIELLPPSVFVEYARIYM